MCRKFSSCHTLYVVLELSYQLLCPLNVLTYKKLTITIVCIHCLSFDNINVERRNLSYYLHFLPVFPNDLCMIDEQISLRKLAHAIYREFFRKQKMKILLENF